MKYTNTYIHAHTHRHTQHTHTPTYTHTHTPPHTHTHTHRHTRSEIDRQADRDAGILQTDMTDRADESQTKKIENDAEAQSELCLVVAAPGEIIDKIRRHRLQKSKLHVTSGQLCIRT